MYPYVLYSLHILVKFVTLPEKCSQTASAVSLLPSSLSKSIISERRSAHP